MNGDARLDLTGIYMLLTVFLLIPIAVWLRRRSTYTAKAAQPQYAARPGKTARIAETLALAIMGGAILAIAVTDRSSGGYLDPAMLADELEPYIHKNMSRLTFKPWDAYGETQYAVVGDDRKSLPIYLRTYTFRQMGSGDPMPFRGWILAHAARELDEALDAVGDRKPNELERHLIPKLIQASYMKRRV